MAFDPRRITTGPPDGDDMQFEIRANEQWAIDLGLPIELVVRELDGSNEVTGSISYETVRQLMYALQAALHYHKTAVTPEHKLMQDFMMEVIDGETGEIVEGDTYFGHEFTPNPENYGL